MADMVFFCPHCKQRLEASPELAGSSMGCPACGGKLRVPPARPQSSAAVSMGILKTRGPSAAIGTRDLVGRLFGKDRVLEKIAEGGMGSVWLTEHEELKVRRALKTMPDGFSNQQDLVQRFHQEAKVLAQLQHPNIAQVHDFGCEGGVYYFIMEYLSGGSLRKRLTPRGTRLSWREALAITDEICAGLEFAHSKKVVHRDIKPENILFDEHGHARIADFGLGKILGDVYRSQSGSLKMGQQGQALDVGAGKSMGQRDTVRPSAAQARDVGAGKSMGQRDTVRPSAAQMTIQGQVVGTMDYMSPEQRRGENVTAQTDIYALGVTLFEMLTGELPSGMETPSERAPGCPSEIDGLVKHMMASADRRFTTVKAVREGLVRINLQYAESGEQRAVGGKRPFAAVAVGLAVVAAAAAGWTAFTFVSARGERTVALELSAEKEARAKLVAQQEQEVADREIRHRTLLEQAAWAETNRQWQSAMSAYQAALGLQEDDGVRKSLARVTDTLTQAQEVERKRGEYNGLIAEAAQSVADGDYASARAKYNRAADAAPTPESREAALESAKKMEGCLASQRLSVSLKKTLCWSADAAAPKHYPSSEQVINKEGDVLGELSIGRGAIRETDGNSADLGRLAHLDFAGPTGVVRICSFRVDDPVGQIRVGKAEGLAFAGRVVEVKGDGETRFQTITVVVSVVPVGQSPLDLDGQPPETETAAKERMKADSERFKRQTKKNLFDDFVRQGKKAEDEKDWQAAKDIYVQALALAPDLAASNSVRASGSRVVAALKDQTQRQQQADEDRIRHAVAQTVTLGLTTGRLLTTTYFPEKVVFDKSNIPVGKLSLSAKNPRFLDSVAVVFTGSKVTKVCVIGGAATAGQILHGQGDGFTFEGRIVKARAGRLSGHGDYLEELVIQMNVLR